MGNPARLVDRRRAEDSLAYKQLGCGCDYLDFPDAIYRGKLEEDLFYYDSMGALFGDEIHPDETTLSFSIASNIREYIKPDTTIIAPLGLGGHVDHKIVHEAAIRYLSRDTTVHYYEEFPYGDPEYPGLKGLDTAGVHRPLDEVTTSASLFPTLSIFDEQDLDRKIRAIAEYRSQIQLIFGQDPTWPTRIHAFSKRFGEVLPAERFWQPAG
jgi:LmbE family N-acetylglucosaminyl deacetylase